MRYLQHSSWLALVVLLSLAWGCPEGEFPVFDSGSDSPFSATVAVDPADREAEQELTLTFTVFRDGEPLSDLAPVLEFDGPAMGEIALTPGALPGEYVGAHFFDVAGTYPLTLRFTADGEDQAVLLTLNVEPNDEG